MDPWMRSMPLGNSNGYTKITCQAIVTLSIMPMAG